MTLEHIGRVGWCPLIVCLCILYVTNCLNGDGLFVVMWWQMNFMYIGESVRWCVFINLRMDFSRASAAMLGMSATCRRDT